jgi:hypothetical protein
MNVHSDDNSQQDSAMNPFSDTEHGNTLFCVISTRSELVMGRDRPKGGHKV